MDWKIKFDKDAEKDLEKLDNSIRTKVVKFLKKLQSREDPRSLGEQLTGKLSGCLKYRIGDFRLVGEIKDDVFVVLILVVAKRETVYKIANKRFSKSSQ